MTTNAKARQSAANRILTDVALKDLHLVAQRLFELFPNEHPLEVYFMMERELGLAVRDEGRRRRGEF
jgi:hypothetical protein